MAKGNGSLDRLPPHSDEAERGVLGCMLLSPAECIGECIEKLKEGASAFYDLRNAEVYQHMTTLYESGVEVDVITLQEALKHSGKLEEVGGIEYLNRLPDTVPSAANLSYYLDIVREKAMIRRMLNAYTVAGQRLMEHDGDVDVLLDKMEALNTSLAEARDVRAESAIGDVVKRVMDDEISQFRQGVKFQVGPLTGFNYLDNIVPGLGAGQLIVLAARPGMGKSALAMQIAENIAERDGTAVGFATLEMTERSLIRRALCQRAGVDLTKLTNGFMQKTDPEKLTTAAGELLKLPVYVDEQPRLSIEEYEVKARRMARQRKVKVLFIDYFQLMYLRRPRRGSSKSEDLAEVSMRLKALAKELSVPVVVLAQMNRDIERETYRRPRLSDLKDTGQLEQDADVVMFLWKRDPGTDAFKERARQIIPRMKMVPDEWRAMEEKNFEGKFWHHYMSIVTLTVEKHREGRSQEDGAMVFIRPWTRFVDAYTPAKKKEPKEEQEEMAGVTADNTEDET